VFWNHTLSHRFHLPLASEYTLETKGRMRPPFSDWDSLGVPINQLCCRLGGRKQAIFLLSLTSSSWLFLNCGLRWVRQMPMQTLMRFVVMGAEDECDPFYKAYASLATDKASPALVSDALYTRCTKNCVSKLQPSGFDGKYDPDRVLRSMAPPKRFYMAFWRSAAYRLLCRCAPSAKPSCTPGLAAEPALI
jgi:hypothetical protein